MLAPIIDCELVNELRAPGADCRFGVSIVANPTPAILRCGRHVQHLLQLLEPDQYYYRSRDLHLTVLEIVHNRTQHEVNAIARAVADKLPSLLAGVRCIELSASEVRFDGKAVALSFRSENLASLALLRRKLTSGFEALGIAVKPRYRGDSAHVTLMRYVKPLCSDCETWVQHLRGIRVPPEAWVVKEVWLTWGAIWYGRPERAHRLGAFRLAPHDERG